MKINYRFPIIIICFFLAGLNTVSAQITPLKVGDKCPDTLSRYLKQIIYKNSYNDGSSKAILIDFWATWCSPCLAALPIMDSLQKKHINNLKIISVTEDNDESVPEVLSKIFSNNGISLTIVTKDRYIKQYFPHQTVPHYVWIAQDGTIKAITGEKEILSDELEKFLNNEILEVKMKPNKIKYDMKRPMYASNQASIGNELVYHSMIAKYRADLNPVYSRGRNYITCINSPILRLFQIAYGKFDLQFLDMNRIIISGLNTQIDSAALGMFTNDNLIALWKKSIDKNAFTYELSLPDSTFTNDQMFKFMQEDLNRYFIVKGITAQMEKRSRPVIALTFIGKTKNPSFKQTSEKASYYSTSTFMKMVNQPISFFISQVTPFLEKQSAPLINETGYYGKISVELNGDLKNIDSLNRSLKKYSLKLVQKNEPIDMIVLTIIH